MYSLYCVLNTNIFMLFSGVFGPDCSADGHLLFRCYFYLCIRRQSVCTKESVDVLRVIRNLLCVTHCAQLLRRVPSQTPMESGGTGTANDIYRPQIYKICAVFLFFDGI